MSKNRKVDLLIGYKRLKKCKVNLLIGYNTLKKHKASLLIGHKTFKNRKVDFLRGYKTSKKHKVSLLRGQESVTFCQFVICMVLTHVAFLEICSLSVKEVLKKEAMNTLDKQQSTSGLRRP